MQQALQPIARSLAPFPVQPGGGDPARPSTRASTGRRAGVSGLAALAILSGTIAVAAAAITTHTLWAPLDEGVHLDYVLSARDGRVVRPGDLIDPAILRDVRCRGIDWPGWRNPDCSFSEEEFLGYASSQFNYVHVHVPVYYFLTAWMSAPLEGVMDGVRDAARLVDGLWVGLGLLAFAGVARRWSVPAWAVGIIVVLFATTPAVFYSSIAVTNDATALLAGSLVLAAVLTWERDRRRAWMPAAAAAIAVALKATNLVAVLAGAAYLVIRANWPDRSHTGHAANRRALLAQAVATLLAGVAVLAVWVAVRPDAPSGYVDPMQVLFGVSSLSFGDVAGELPALVPPVRASLVPSFLDGPFVRWAAVAFAWLLGGTAALAIVRKAASGRLRALAIAAIFGLIGGALVTTLGNFIFQRVFLEELPPRYGLSALPFLGICLGAGMLHRPVGIMAVVTAAAAACGIGLGVVAPL